MIVTRILIILAFALLFHKENHRQAWSRDCRRKKARPVEEVVPEIRYRSFFYESRYVGYGLSK
jgi:hypothetical protein